MTNPVQQTTLETEIRELKRRIADLERVPRYKISALPHFSGGGIIRDFGFISYDSTDFVEMTRMDVPVTAPMLHYDFQTGKGWGTGITSVDWRIRAWDYTTRTWHELLSGSDTVSGTQHTGSVDIFNGTIGEQALNRYMRISLEIKRVGGSGDAAVRMVRSWTLRQRT